MRSKLVFAVAAAAFLNVVTCAAEANAPDATTVVIPDLSGSTNPSVVKDGWKFFLFQRAGVSFAEAYSDFADCQRFLQPANYFQVMFGGKFGRFVPWYSQGGTLPKYVPSPQGLPADLLIGLTEGTFLRRDYQAKMRRCMEPRGYVRYGVAEEIWQYIYKLPQEEWVAVQAKIASDPSFGGKVPAK